MKKLSTTSPKRVAKFPIWYLVVVAIVIGLSWVGYVSSQRATVDVVWPKVEAPVQEYVSTQAGIRMKFDKPYFVTESQQTEDGILRGDIVISTIPGGDEGKTHLAIVYGIPYIDGKGGACGDENGSSWKKMRILDEELTVCDRNLVFHAGYPKNKTKEVEYSFFIGGEGITVSEFDEYKRILSDGLFYIHK
jgi:hypothetical protein